MSVTGTSQLGLGLVRERIELPALPLAPDWKGHQRLWGHSFHPMCSYLASFPAALAHAFIARWSRPGDVVLDPFSGRGTVPLQAAAEGRIGVGNDLNPFAHLLTAAKVEPPTEADVRTRLAALRLGWAADGGRGGDVAASGGVAGAGGPGVDGDAVVVAEAVPPEVRVSFAPGTLAQLLYLRRTLRLEDRTDRFIAATIAGILHGKSASYLSPLMPNTFSMAPNYVREFAARTGFVAPEREVFGRIERKVGRLFRQPPPAREGIALLGDARDAGARTVEALRARRLPDRARLVVTSPPYLRVVKYGYYNWLRTWFLGMDAAAIDRSLDDGHRLRAYLDFLREALAGLRPALADDAVVVLVIGDVERDRGRKVVGTDSLVEAVWEEAAAPGDYRLAGVVADAIAPGRKMTKLWGETSGRATGTDRILVLGATEAGRRRAIAGAATPVDWTWPPRGLRPL